GGDHVLGFRFRRDHDEGNFSERRIGAHFLQQYESRHRLHVPVGNDQAVVAPAQFGERGGAIAGIVDLFEAKLLEQVVHDANHSVVVVYNENWLGQIDSHLRIRPTGLSPVKVAIDSNGP